MVTSPVSFSHGAMPQPAPAQAVNSPAAQAEQRRQQAYWQQFNPMLVLPHISADQVIRGLQAGEELIPAMAPQLSHVTPLISVSYAGKDIYSRYNQVYKKTEGLPTAKRVRKIAAEMGDVVLFHLFSTFLIPLLLVNKVGKWVKEKVVKHPRMPARIATHPKLVTAAILTVIALATNKPVSTATNAFLDLTYRPLVEKRKREKLIKQQQELWKQYLRLKSQFPAMYQPYLASFQPLYSPFFLPVADKSPAPAKSSFG